jgi:hypothetical protein
MNKQPEELKVHGIYEAEFDGLGKKRSPYDGQRDPRMIIYPPSVPYPGNSPYFGYMAFNRSRRETNPEKIELSNKIRQDLIQGRIPEEFVFVEILFNIAKRPAGPYLLTGVHEKFVDEKIMDKNEAFSVLISNNAFYAQYQIPESAGEEESPSLLAYDQDGNPLSGYLHVKPRLSDHNVRFRNHWCDEARTFAENIITREIIFGNKKHEYKGISPGDCLIVRKAGMLEDKIVFEPVINFREEDEAISPEGIPLVTDISHDNDMGFIQDIPIVGTTRLIKDNEFAGFGYLPRSHYETDSMFFFKTVVIKGAFDDIGKYTRVSRIIKNGKNVIFAEKIA